MNTGKTNTFGNSDLTMGLCDPAHPL